MKQKTRQPFLKLAWEERLKEERKLWESGFQRVAGLDEAGRGPLAGPVVAAVFVITPGFFREDLNDSKQMTPVQRENCYNFLTAGDWGYGVGVVEPDEIDRINIYQASRRAMSKALQALNQAPDYLLVDALMVPDTEIPQTALIHGDAEDYDRVYPGYGFAQHKGYPTVKHYEALERLGPSPIHRKSFRLRKEPVPDNLNLF
jgi:ribonuclease HII